MQNYERYLKMIEAWRNFKFPARPGDDEMEIFDELMNRYKGKKLLILGATPEFRDLAIEYEMDTTCADVNPDMLEGMKLLMKNQSTEEKLVECNWLDMPFEDNSFDVIFAEQSVNIVTTDKFEDFFKECHRVLKPGGGLVLKTIIQNTDNDENIIKLYRENNYPIHFLYDQLFHVQKRLDKNGQGSHKKLGDDFGQLLKEGKITQEEHDKFFEAWGEIVKADLRLNVMERQDIENLIKKYFEIKETLFGQDKLFHRLHPIYVLIKK